MSLQTITRQIVIPGMSMAEYFGSEGQFQSSLAIDPDMPVNDSAVKPSGLIRPTQMAKFSGTEVTGAPLWMITNPKDTNCYVYTADGKIHTVASNLSMGTALNSGNAMTAASGNGAAYYDNYLYLRKNVDVARYGPLNGTPSLTQNYWSTTLSLTAPTNTTYFSINGVAYPNGMMFKHTNDALYYCDVLASNKGCLHKIKTTKTTVEGDTNDGSAVEVLDFDYGVFPNVISNHGLNLLIGLFQGTSTAIKQSRALLALWDTISDSYSDITPENMLGDAFITAIHNVNGEKWIFSGPATGGCRITRFVGVNMTEEIAFIPHIYPPFPGAVDHFLTKVLAGTMTSEPGGTNVGAVYSIGSINNDFKYQMGVHCPLKATSAGTNPIVTALKYLTATNSKIQPIIGWKDSAACGLDKITTTANTALVIKAVIDDGDDTQTLLTINNTNFSSEKLIDENITQIQGKSNFYLQYEWSNGAIFKDEVIKVGGKFKIKNIKLPLAQKTAASFVGTINMPIKITIDIKND